MLQIVSNFLFKTDPYFGKIYYLSVKRSDGSDNITWSELQDFKNSIYGENSQALEVYPKESEVINHANVRHLWIIDSNFVIPFSTKI